jgi:outer membrane translocation and assembly module TamA
VDGRRRTLGSIVDRDGPFRARSALRTVTTFEVADPALGGRFTFWRVVSDHLLGLATGDDQAVFLRFRVGGGEDLPLHKQEALGGWGSLRGYEFKELRGDWSLLGALEYRLSVLAVFLDVGAVRAPGGDWTGPRLGVGTGLNLGDGQLGFAWRTDGDAQAKPELRLLFGRAW